MTCYALTGQSDGMKLYTKMTWKQKGKQVVFRCFFRCLFRCFFSRFPINPSINVQTSQKARITLIINRVHRIAPKKQASHTIISVGGKMLERGVGARQ